ncbi:uncharacterized protein TrAFT101_007214 [Trichoderma asperellum]|uniref:DUF7707 domain-containing protein n=1 Tax=Trichoderma asperellum (strain ATCC 204424 / CBS 433.97 / NBRC 101777) TaxID=1042311 RepID=A0A2T3YWI9_TRIA4|nr:hypothetical protein M441DRAFT_83544 [Trichoderma asperellum CBS 433.97]PTB36928.1 hypothetical protein M441DRAFT_83544 [Trichoderma asperellum CBS 433.97]UKZ92252.1 hypothetical protein TrAFT101_007214 [Trichoderma asperellum]
MRSSAIFVAIAATAVSAQTVPTYKSSLNMTIDPNSVPQQQRAVWCQGQTNTCQVLCDNNTDLNDCNQAQLTFDCTCAANNSAPGLQYYTQTLPTFICQQLFSNCIQANAGNADGQDQCKSNIQKLCATHNPPTIAEISSLADASTAATTAATTSAASHAATTSADKTASSSAQSTTSKALAAATMGPVGAGAFAMAAAGLAAYAL